MNGTENGSATELTDAWTKVAESVTKATDLYLEELSEYLDWVRDFQREILAQSLVTSQNLSRWGEREWAYMARLRETIPAVGGIPKGPGTVAGMVDAVVRETARSE